MAYACFSIIFILFVFQKALCSELTFELPDRDKACYHQELEANVQSNFEFQVITGGKYDVDVVLRGPNGEELYKVEKKQYDTHEINPAVSGVYQLCFSNEFSTFTHKVVYFEWTGAPAKKLGSAKPTALTQMESSAVRVHDTLRVVEDFQTSFRHKEAQGRAFAEDLNERTMYWSIGQTCIILLVGIGQVLILKSFFTEKKGSGTSAGITT